MCLQRTKRVLHGVGGVMQDPFFDEDNGEFDDLYGNPPPASPPRNSRHKQRNSELPAASVATPRGRSSLRSPAASTSVVSRSYTRDRTGSMASTTTDLAASGKGKKRKKPRRKGSQELFDGVKWQTDAQVTKCGLCRSDFSLVRRKHHCRHCGRVICADCSVFLFFELSHRKHRVCCTCNNRLLDEQEQFERETLVPGSNDTTSSRLFEDSSEDAGERQFAATSNSGDAQHNQLHATFANAFASKRNGGDDEKAKKKQEKKERKERRKKEKLDRKRKEALGSPVAQTPREIVKVVEVKPSDNGAALFNATDDAWFTDAPDQNTRSRASSDGYSVEEGAESKGTDWRDRVKDTYTVESASGQPSALAPMTGSMLTAGITGNGYFSDQFRYDVAGPGLGHDDDFSAAMPRPKQQSVPTPYHDQRMRPSERKSVHDGDSEGKDSSEINFQPRLTFKDSLKDLLGGTNRRESSATKVKNTRTNKPRARGDQNMTLDELNPSYSSEDEPYTLTPAMPRPATTPVNPSFYDYNADKLVVDDSPGFFEATVAEREVQKKHEEQRLQQMVKDSTWVNNSAPPPSGLPNRFSSEQDSYTMVDLPSHTSNSPVGKKDDDGARGEPRESGKGGFAGALKRFFGMKSKPTGKTTAPSKPVEVQSTVAPPENNKSEPHTPALSGSRQLSNTNMVVPPSSDTYSARHTIVDHGTKVDEPPPQENFRYTVTGYTDMKSSAAHFDPLVPSQIGGSHDNYEVQPKMQQNSLKRRGTFDGLFDSPKNNIAVNGADRYSTTSTGGWDARVGDNSSFDRPSNGARTVGVSRFDERRSVDEDDGFILGADRVNNSRVKSFNDSVDARRPKSPAATSVLYGRNDVAPSADSGFTWSSVQAAPGFGTATFAIPTSLQPRAIYDDDRGSSFRNDTVATQPASLGNIMDDLKRGSLSKETPGKESVEDFFAEFEEPNDYVFDPTTGGYVASKAPPRAAAPPRHTGRSESTELQTPRMVQEKTGYMSRDRDYGVGAEPVAISTARAITPMKLSDEEEVGDEVADIIVDKISSLEGELAALKQLIRNRKGNGDNGQVHNPRAGYSADARPSTRKESIFDNDSSDEEGTKATSSTAWPKPKRETKRRPRSKKHSTKKRKDSFAGLFDEDSDKETLGVATSYEALFQTGAKTKGASEEENSDEDADLTAKPLKTHVTKPRRRSSRKSIDFIPAGPESGSEPEFPSLKGRRGKLSIKQKKGDGNADDDDMGFKPESKSLTKAPPAASITTLKKSAQKQISVVEEEDPIDALFDSSNDHDVTKLYGSDDENVLPTSPIAPISKNKSLHVGQPPVSTLSSDEESGHPSTPSVKMEFAATASPDASTYSLGSRVLDDGDEDDGFSINWKKMRSTKLRRRGSRRKSSIPSNVGRETPDAIDKTNELLSDPSLLSASSELNDALGNAIDIKGEEDSASTNWMTVNEVVGKTVSLDLVSDGESIPTLDSEKRTGTMSDGPNIVEEKKSDEQDATPLTTVGTNLKIEEATLLEHTSETVLASERDYPVGELPILSADSVETRPHIMETAPKESNPSFDIFDKSSDMDFVSMATPMEVKTPAYEEEREDSGNDYDAGVEQDDASDDEPFSFEIKASKKRVTDLDMPTSIPRAISVPDNSESSPPSPSSSVDDDNVVFGKYAVSSVPLSRTPSIDGSLDDQEDASVVANTDTVLGKIESQDFDTDWQRMQEKEKERKKKLQIKQRQAQRDKILRKQTASSKTLSGDATTHSSSKSKAKSGKKKKKDQGDTASSSSHHKKSGSSSRKHRYREKGDSSHTEPPRSLTEL